MKNAWPVTRSTFPPSNAPRHFELNDGVSCENCHGPAAGWLGPHTVKDWENQSSSRRLKLGMY